jgi:hypothetical protein
MNASLEAARRCGATRVEMGTENLIADMCMIYDLPGAEAHCLAGLVLARRRGARAAELNVTNNFLYVLTLAGRFDEAYRLADELLNVSSDESGHLDPFLHGRLASLDALRGNIEGARSHLRWCREFGESDDVQSVAMFATCEAAVALAEGDNVRAFDSASRAIEVCVRDLRILVHESVRASFPDAVDAALALGDLEAVDRLVGDFTDRPSPHFFGCRSFVRRPLLTQREARTHTLRSALWRPRRRFGTSGTCIGRLACSSTLPSG